jgi:serine/threonine protein kinase
VALSVAHFLHNIFPDPSIFIHIDINYSERGGYGLMDVGVWLWQLACALCALLDAKIVHMDVKVDNILLIEGVGGVDEVLLADFGIGREVPEGGLPTHSRTIAIGQEHVGIEMEGYIKDVHQLLSNRLGSLDVPMDTIVGLERDLAAIMSRYAVDESLDMCKGVRVCV